MAPLLREDLEDEINGIVFDTGTGRFTAVNLDGTRGRRGVELTAAATMTANLRFSGSYTYTDATQPDPVTGVDIREIRRPRHSASFNGNWRFLASRAGLNFNLTYVGTGEFFFESRRLWYPDHPWVPRPGQCSLPVSADDRASVYALLELLDGYEKATPTTPWIGAFAAPGRFLPSAGVHSSRRLGHINGKPLRRSTRGVTTAPRLATGRRGRRIVGA